MKKCVFMVLIISFNFFLSCSSGSSKLENRENTTDADIQIKVCKTGDTRDSNKICGINNEGVFKQKCSDGSWQDLECTGSDKCVNNQERNSAEKCGINDNGVFREKCVEGKWRLTDVCNSEMECENDEISEGLTICGLNGEGVFIQKCISGLWQDGLECTGKDKCENGKEQNGSTLCGLNNEGVLKQKCISGQWLDGEKCSGSDECQNNQVQKGTTACGFNNKGVLKEKCISGLWQSTDECIEQDECENDKTQESSIACGANNEGFLIKKCILGLWQETTDCTGKDECKNGEIDSSTILCGSNSEGFLIKKCVLGVWQNTTDCTGKDECKNDETENSSIKCGLNDEGFLIKKCVLGIWQNTADCTGDDKCKNGLTQPGTTVCGLSSKGFFEQKCEDGNWKNSDNCIGDILTCSSNVLCDSICCGDGEICFEGKTCVLPTKTCQYNEDCPTDEYCEPLLQKCIKKSSDTLCQYRPPVGEFLPKVGCKWTAPNDDVFPTAGESQGKLSDMSDVVMTPVVANLTDDNGDGKTDKDDMPDIAFISFNYAKGDCCTDKGVLRIVSGECNEDGTMNTIATIDDVWMGNSSGIAIANLDPDDQPAEKAPELVVTFKNGGSVAWKRESADGTKWKKMWQNDTYLTALHYNWGGAQPSIADLNGDGKPEVIIGNVVLDGQTGDLIWDGNVTSGESSVGGIGNNAFLGPVSLVSDIDLDGTPDVIAGNTAYDGFTGAVKWTYEFTTNNSDCQGKRACDGFDAIGNFDSDNEAEVVIIRQGEVFVLEHDGTLKYQAAIPPFGADRISRNEGGPPTVADFDGDGRPEIGVASAKYYVVFDFDCKGTPLPEGCADENILWMKGNNDSSSRATSSSVFDFDADGKAEVVYADEKTFRIFDGTTGKILLDDKTHTSNTRLEMPIVVDVNNDNKSEILVGSASGAADVGGLTVWVDSKNNWVRTRSVWNQHSYHVTNIDDSGQVPRYEEPNWLNKRYNNFRQNLQPDNLFLAPDLLIKSIDVVNTVCDNDSENEVTIKVEITNDGSLGVPPGIYLSLKAEYSEDKNPISIETDIGYFKTDRRLLPKQTIELEIKWETTVKDITKYRIIGEIDKDASGLEKYNECYENNNVLTSKEFDGCVDIEIE